MSDPHLQITPFPLVQIDAVTKCFGAKIAQVSGTNGRDSKPASLICRHGGGVRSAGGGVSLPRTAFPGFGPGMGRLARGGWQRCLFCDLSSSALLDARRVVGRGKRASVQEDWPACAGGYPSHGL